MLFVTTTVFMMVTVITSETLWLIWLVLSISIFEFQVVLATPDVSLNQSVTISEGSFSLGESNDNEEESGSLNSEFWDEFEDWKSLMFTVPHPFTPMGRKCAHYRSLLSIPKSDLPNVRTIFWNITNRIFQQNHRFHNWHQIT
ncbi:uncharacterized protein LOC142349548 [Convolutriloba macropyga]|uniref:uncharacterized protein LOC142349548 n=1 Tax=Convolutriloba macropyga TaxID=536237 RepID=UPI003F51FC41